MTNNNDDALDFERISLFYNNTSFAYTGSAIAICFLGYIIYNYATPVIAFVWVSLVIFFNIPRIITSNRFIQKVNDGDITAGNARPWERYYFICCILPFFTLSSAVLLPYEENVFICILYCTLMNLCLVTGTVVVYCGTKAIMILHISIYLLLPIMRLLFYQDMMATLIASFLFIAYVMFLRVGNSQNKVLIENILLKLKSENQSLIDPLTQLWNRRRLYLYIDKLIPASQRRDEPFSIILLDIDHFKEFNDRYGHDIGDELLSKVAKILLNCSREQDLVVRYGGEEFMIVLPSTNIEQAKIIIERIQENIKENVHITISAGLAIYAGNIVFQKLVKQADKALYEAKETGRNKYIIAEAV